jgi:phosphatidylethanolamine/phosphatidyl-N-methylethanolamine N-methyltransferase
LTDQTFALADNLRFLKALITRPKNVGAIVPSSPALSRAIAHVIDTARSGPVLELGPGTGVLTQAILERGIAPERLTLVEYDGEMAAHLAHRFPRVHVVQGDAFDLERTLGDRHGEQFSAIVSGLPLLNFPLALRHSYMAGLIARLEPGAPVIQFSYGTQAPVSAPPGCVVSRAALVWANIPPARVWVYRKT